jgi:hypothetical protein
MSAERSRVSQEELEKVMNQYDLQEAFHVLRERRTTNKQLWQSSKSCQKQLYQKKLEEILQCTHKEMHKIQFLTLIKLLLKKILSSLGKTLYLSRRFLGLVKQA